MAHKTFTTLTHGHAKRGKRSGSYKTWLAMRHRCKSTDAHHGRFYRDVSVCQRWEVFENFLEDMGERPEGQTLDRIDSSKGYSKENCQWATMREQQNNRKSNVYYRFKGEQKTLAELAHEYGVPYKKVWSRVNQLGWSIEKALEI